MKANPIRFIVCLFAGLFLLIGSSLAAGVRPQTESPSTADSDSATLLFFTAPWCEPCLRIKPVLAKECNRIGSRVRMVSIDYDRSPAAVQDFRVERLPTMLLLDHEGRLLVRVEGAGKEGFDALLQRIRNHGKAQRKQPGRK